MANTVAQFVALLAATASIKTTAPPLGFPQELQQSWAQYSPWFPAATYVPPPPGCDVVQVRTCIELGRDVDARLVWVYD
jgi:hypothetical protein